MTQELVERINSLQLQLQISAENQIKEVLKNQNLTAVVNDLTERLTQTSQDLETANTDLGTLRKANVEYQLKIEQLIKQLADVHKVLSHADKVNQSVAEALELPDTNIAEAKKVEIQDSQTKYKNQFTRYTKAEGKEYTEDEIKELLKDEEETPK